MEYSRNTTQAAKKVKLEWDKIAAKEADPKVKTIDVGKRLNLERRLIQEVMYDLGHI